MVYSLSDMELMMNEILISPMRATCPDYLMLPHLISLKITSVVHNKNFKKALLNIIRLRWSRGSVLAFSTQVCEFKPGRNRRIFRAKKSSQHAFLRRGSKAVGPMS